MNSIRLKARAKINLGLDIIGVRGDGYHEVRMVMQTIGLYDDIYIEKTREQTVELMTNLSFLPTNENNLMVKAAQLLMEEFDITSGIRMRLNKFIPVAAGLAGGSSDAAAVLFGMNRMFDLGLSMRELMKRGVKIGADVPYCIMRGTALAEGIGEKLTKLPAMPRCSVLVAKPAINVSTRMVYEAFDKTEITEHPDIDGILAALERGQLCDVAAHMGNILEQVTIPMYPVIASIRHDMLEHGAIQAMMSGSGPTVFGLFHEEKDAKHCLELLKAKGEARQVYTTRIE